MDAYRKYIVGFIWGISGILIAAFILFGGLFYIAETERRPRSSADEAFCGVPNLPEEVQQGKALFYQHCLACHKLDMDGSGPGLRNADPLVLQRWLLVDPAQKDQVEYGRMFHLQTFKNQLSEEDIQSVQTYLTY
ncbi:c-type cytochrome [Myroides fluvii]|uniref:c-type cytochrome n=1 Tax=Myroides fluvii TaxID=2572594 RepID=UPI00131BFEE0|nr:cytochrome c [Myroides fluvii]